MNKPTMEACICGGEEFVRENDTENLVCRRCGVVQKFNNFVSPLYGNSGPEGTTVETGSSGTGNRLPYKEAKVYKAKKSIKDLAYKLGLSELRSDEVRLMIERLTDREYGEGDWFRVCIGACIYVVMRRDHKTLTIVDVANVIGCDRYTLGGMIKRMVHFLGVKLPEFDIIGLLEHTLKTCRLFNGGLLSEDVIRRMLKQGVFLVHCLMIWSLTTGRTPMPVVAAVLMFVSELNDVRVKTQELTAELCVGVDTYKRRYKEIVQSLVKVGQKNLPWGKDVTDKNIVKHAPYIMRYMELKSMNDNGLRSLEPVEFDLNVVLNDCLSKKAANESQYESCGISRIPLLSHESLALIHSEYVKEIPLAAESSAENGMSRTRWDRAMLDFRDCGDWWTGKSDLSKKLLFEQILEKDIGLNANPPSFDQGCLKYQKRKAKIEAAKVRIERIMHPSKPCSCGNSGGGGGKKRKKREVEIDWEDFIIETLLLHQVKEEEIAKGYYKALIDLYVFTC